MKYTTSKKLPLNCPFCDEPAMQEKFTRRLVTSDRIFTLRQCDMGHEFYTVEYIPEDQSEIAKEVKEIRRIRRDKDE